MGTLALTAISRSGTSVAKLFDKLKSRRMESAERKRMMGVIDAFGLVGFMGATILIHFTSKEQFKQVLGDRVGDVVGVLMTFGRYERLAHTSLAMAILVARLDLRSAQKRLRATNFCGVYCEALLAVSPCGSCIGNNGHIERAVRRTSICG